VNTARHIHGNPFRALNELGQSVWLDYVERSFARGGELARLIEEDGIAGVTTNPAILHKAIAEHRTYDTKIAALGRRGYSAEDIQEALIIEDTRGVADLLLATYRKTIGRDGYVSLEVSPHLANDGEETYWEARRLWGLVDRPNLMIKVPGTPQGISAIRRLIGCGINVNVTLLFGVERYAQAAEAYIAGLEDRVERKLPISNVSSVASFFLSRIDTLVDRHLDTIGTHAAEALRGSLAIASAQAAYGRFQAITASPRWQALQENGPRVQRLLWASTGTKDARYSDVKYVEELVGADTVTTLPIETLAAFRDHGYVERRLPASSPAAAAAVLQALVRCLSTMGLDWERALSRLEEEGIRKFVEPQEATLAAVRARTARG
jgi:transaldolase